MKTVTQNVPLKTSVTNFIMAVTSNSIFLISKSIYKHVYSMILPLTTGIHNNLLYLGCLMHTSTKHIRALVS